MTSNKVPIAITMGDPAGIGPEISLKVAGDTSLPARPLIIGDPSYLATLAQRMGLEVDIVTISAPKLALELTGKVAVLPAERRSAISRSARLTVDAARQPTTIFEKLLSSLKPAMSARSSLRRSIKRRCLLPVSSIQAILRCLRTLAGRESQP